MEEGYRVDGLAMPADSIESAERISNLWRHIRFNQACLKEVEGWDVFFKTSEFNGKEIPVATRSETIEHIKTLLTADIARLTKEAAPDGR